jgi:hypothetical protein
MAADTPYGEFYDFYSVSPEYFGYLHVVACSELGDNKFLLPWFPESVCSDINIRTHKSSSLCVNAAH